MAKKKIYDLYVSIGAVCSCTSTLRAANLQFFSYPLDWVGGCTVLERAELIASEFNGWFEKEDLNYIRTNPEPYNKDVYTNKKTDMLFVHDFPANSSFDEYYPKVKGKYDRRINRLTKLLEGAKSVLFVYIDVPYRKPEEETSNQMLKESIEVLEKRFPNTKINILYIFNVNGIEFKNREIIEVNDKVTKIKFDYNKYDEDLQYEVRVDKLLKVFKDYKISNRYLTFKNKIDVFKKKTGTYIKNIFSVRNEYDGTQKIKTLTILGLKWRLKH